jgi:cobaltochelatase CobS
MTAMSSEDIVKAILDAQQASGSSGEPKEKKVETPPPELKPLASKTNLGDGEQWFKDVFGFKPPSGLDHAVRVFKDEDWPEHVRMFIPEVDEGFVFPKNETEVAVVGLILAADKVFAHGPKGSGKSTLFPQICARLRIPFMRINCRQDMDSSAIFGSITVHEGRLDWVDGPAAVLAKTGGVLQIDEISATPAGINMSMQWMLEKGGKVFLAEKPSAPAEKLINPHQWFRVACTDNTELQGDTKGGYAGTMVQNEAMLDRFGTTIKMNYLSRKEETSIIKSRVPDLDKYYIEQMLNFAGLVRTAYLKGEVQFTMSPRALINWAEKIVLWGDITKALQIAFFDKLIEDDQKKINEFVVKVFGGKGLV